MTEYTATTSNASNKVTATPEDPDAEITITVGNDPLENEASASWEVGENTLTIEVVNGTAEKTYTVTVTREAPAEPEDP